MEEVKDPPPPTPAETDKVAVLAFRSAVFQTVQKLRQGDPLRAELIEALLLFQINASPELRP